MLHSGYQALYSNTTGDYNTANGDQALYHNITGDYNTAVGCWAGPNSSSSAYSNQTAIGYNTENTASNQVRIGNSDVTSIGGYANWTNISDAHFKKDINENVPGLDFVLKLRPVTYHLDMDAIANFYHTPDSLRLKDAEQIKGNMLQSGFLAQEVEQTAKELNFDFSGVNAPKNDNEHYGLRYAEFVVPLVKAVQEQQTIIDNLQKENKLQQKQLQELQKQIQELQK